MSTEALLLKTAVAMIIFVVVMRIAIRRVVLGKRANTVPEPGQRWFCNDKESGPWPPKDLPPVIIVDVRGGWVRYDMSVFKDQRIKLDDFVRMYRPMQ